MEQVMTKKQKLTVSIIGIFLLLITIVGITYAYFLTKIKGNTNDDSVILSTANLLLKYTDGNGIIEPNEKIMPGTVVESKTFSVENEGTETISNYGVYIENVLNEYVRTEDIKLTLTCKVYDTINEKYLDNECNGVTNFEYPTVNGLIVTNSIDVDIRHEYSLTIKYVYEEEIDQSIDMNKTIKGRIQIYDLNDIINITGTVSEFEDGDYVLLEKNMQTSKIINGTYTLVGILPETQTIYIYNDSINEEGEVVTTIKGSKTILVDHGDDLKFENDILYIPTSIKEVNLNITSINNELILELEK